MDRVLSIESFEAEDPKDLSVLVRLEGRDTFDDIDGPKAEALRAFVRSFPDEFAGPVPVDDRPAPEVAGLAIDRMVGAAAEGPTEERS